MDVYSIGVLFFELFLAYGTMMERLEVMNKLRDKGPLEEWKGDKAFYKQFTASLPSDCPSIDDNLVITCPSIM